MVLRLGTLIFCTPSGWTFYSPGAIVAPMPKLAHLLSSLFVPESNVYYQLQSRLHYISQEGLDPGLTDSPGLRLY